MYAAPAYVGTYSHVYVNTTHELYIYVHVQQKILLAKKFAEGSYSVLEQKFADILFYR